MYKQAAAIAILFMLSAGAQTGVSGQNGLRGVWRIAHVTIEGAHAHVYGRNRAREKRYLLALITLPQNRNDLGPVQERNRRLAHHRSH